MANTRQFGLPLLAAAQAQKHVTVNEALARLDAMAQMRLSSLVVTVPPLNAVDGDAYGVPVGAVNDWDLHSGEVAVFANGGWVFVPPLAGWKAWIADLGTWALFDGSGWMPEVVAVAPGGAMTQQRVIEFDHVVAVGASSATTVAIPAGVQVTGVTGRITTGFSGTLTGWDLGVAGGTNRYGSGLGLAKNSWVRGLSGTPVTYWSDTPLLLSAVGGNFAAGAIRLAIHLVALVPPRAV